MMLYRVPVIVVLCLLAAANCDDDELTINGRTIERGMRVNPKLLVYYGSYSKVNYANKNRNVVDVSDDTKFGEVPLLSVPPMKDIEEAEESTTMTQEEMKTMDKMEDEMMTMAEMTTMHEMKPEMTTMHEMKPEMTTMHEMKPEMTTMHEMKPEMTTMDSMDSEMTTQSLPDEQLNNI